MGKKKTQPIPAADNLHRSPVVGDLKKRPTPRSDDPGPPQKFSFSFKYFRQIENFGLSSADQVWFISLLTRLSEICGLTVDEFRNLADPKNTFRYHPIDWSKKNCPIELWQLDWLDKHYREDNPNYVMYQFAISKGEGRVVGFFDENNVFNIVLLDREHNLQPSNFSDYRIRPNDIVSSEYDLLLEVVQKATIQTCTAIPCCVYQELTNVPSVHQRFSPLVLRLESEDCQNVQDLLDEGCVVSIQQIFEAGIYAKLQELEEQNPSEP